MGAAVRLGCSLHRRWRAPFVLALRELQSVRGAQAPSTEGFMLCASGYWRQGDRRTPCEWAPGWPTTPYRMGPVWLRARPMKGCR